MKAWLVVIVTEFSRQFAWAGRAWLSHSTWTVQTKNGQHMSSWLVVPRPPLLVRDDQWAASVCNFVKMCPDMNQGKLSQCLKFNFFNNVLYTLPSKLERHSILWNVVLTVVLYFYDYEPGQCEVQPHSQTVLVTDLLTFLIILSLTGQNKQSFLSKLCRQSASHGNSQPMMAAFPASLSPTTYNYKPENIT